MNAPRPSYAVVSLPALDVRRRPDHRAELATQLLMGETVRLLPGPARAGWRRIRNEADGYEGWVRDWGIVAASAARAQRWRRAATATVVVPLLGMLARPGGGVAVGPLFLGARAIPGRRRAGHTELELPDGRRGWVDAACLRAPGSPTADLIERVGSLLGVPYLWGGRTPAGIDCSAFVQLVLGEQGLALPRDARDQHAACRAIPRGQAPHLGDLAFFAARARSPGHVGLALGDGYFAHARGFVRIASIDGDNALCDKELSPQFLGWFRPRGATRKFPAGGRRPDFRA
jgi:hypothetical protein